MLAMKRMRKMNSEECYVKIPILPDNHICIFCNNKVSAMKTCQIRATKKKTEECTEFQADLLWCDSCDLIYADFSLMLDVKFAHSGWIIKRRRLSSTDNLNNVKAEILGKDYKKTKNSIANHQYNSFTKIQNCFGIDDIERLKIEPESILWKIPISNKTIWNDTNTNCCPECGLKGYRFNYDTYPCYIGRLSNGNKYFSFVELYKCPRCGIVFTTKENISSKFGISCSDIDVAGITLDVAGQTKRSLSTKLYKLPFDNRATRINTKNINNLVGEGISEDNTDIIFLTIKTCLLSPYSGIRPTLSLEYMIEAFNSNDEGILYTTFSEFVKCFFSLFSRARFCGVLSSRQLLYNSTYTHYCQHFF